MSPMTRRRVGIMERASVKAAAADAYSADLNASAPSAECVYASAATGSGSLKVTLQVGTVGLQVLRQDGEDGTRTKPADGSQLRPLRTLAFAGIQSTEVVGVRAVPLTGRHPSALVVEYRDGTAFTRLEKIFCFMKTEHANKINSCLTSQLQRLRNVEQGSRAALSADSSSRTEMPAALVAMMTTKTKNRCGAKVWAKMSARDRSRATMVMLESFALQGSTEGKSTGRRVLSALSPSPRGTRSAAAKRSMKKTMTSNALRHRPSKAKGVVACDSQQQASQSPRQAVTQSARTASEATSDSGVTSTRIIEYFSDVHGSCAAF